MFIPKTRTLFALLFLSALTASSACMGQEDKPSETQDSQERPFRRRTGKEDAEPGRRPDQRTDAKQFQLQCRPQQSNAVCYQHSTSDTRQIE